MERLALVVRLALAVAVLDGCAGDRAAVDPSSERSNNTTPGRPARRRIVEWIANGGRDAHSCSLLAGARKAARALDVELIVHDAPGMSWAEQQRLLAQRLEDQGHWPQAVVLDPVAYPPPLAWTVRTAHDRGLPVVLVDEPLRAESTPGGAGAAWFNMGFPWTLVSSDEEAVGRRAGTELARLLGGQTGATLVVTSPSSNADRSREFVRGILESPGFPNPDPLTLEGRSPDDDVATARNYLRSHPQLLGAFAADAAAAVALGRAKVDLEGELPVVAGDAEPEQLQLLRSGALQALVVRPGFQVGEVALGVAAKAQVYQGPPEHEIPPPVVLTEESFEGVEPGSMPAGFGENCHNAIGAPAAADL